MTVRTFGCETFRKSLVVLMCFVFISGNAPGLLAQSPTAAISGVILDPEGRPAFGFKVVLRDVGSNTRYTSDPTDAAGNYVVQVPLGGRYKIDGVVADDGVTKLPVQDVPPVSVLTAGTTRLNVRFTNGAAPTAQTAGGTPASEEKEKKKKGGVPWYRRPGPIVGMVLGAVALVAIALSGGGGGSNNVASQSTPTQ